MNCSRCFGEGQFWFRNVRVFCACPLGVAYMVSTALARRAKQAQLIFSFGGGQ